MFSKTRKEHQMAICEICKKKNVCREICPELQKQISTRGISPRKKDKTYTVDFNLLESSQSLNAFQLEVRRRIVQDTSLKEIAWVDLQDVIDNPNIKRIINVDGTGAPITVNNPYQLLRLGPTGLYIDISQIQLNDNYVPFLQPAKFQSTTGIENIDFEITGARHSDFSHVTGDPINIATNLFMRELSKAAVSPDRWNVFIQREGITYDTNRKIYVVDPLKFKRNLNQ